MFYFCHVIGSDKNFNFHGYLDVISIETYRNMGCIVIIRGEVL